MERELLAVLVLLCFKNSPGTALLFATVHKSGVCWQNGVQDSTAHAEYRNVMPVLRYTLWTRLLLLLGKSFSVVSAEAGILLVFL